MDQTELIDTVQSHLDSKVSVPVRTKGGTGDERPVPAVILEDVDIRDITLHNTHLAGVEEKPPGTSDLRLFHFRYKARLDFAVRHTSDREASLLQDKLRAVFEPLTENPRSLDSDLSEVNLRGGGGFSLTNVEDKESSMNFAVQIRTFHAMDNTEDAAFDSSVLDTIENTLPDGDGEDFTVS